MSRVAPRLPIGAPIVCWAGQPSAPELTVGVGVAVTTGGAAECYVVVHRLCCRAARREDGAKREDWKDAIS